MDLNEMLGMVSNFTSADNTIRNAAEEKFAQYTPELKFVGLCQLLGCDIKDDDRVMALVLIRRIVAFEFCVLWSKIDENTQKAILEGLLQLGLNPNLNASVRHKVILVIAQIANEFVDKQTGSQTWRAVIDFLSHCAQSDDVTYKCSALQLLEACSGIFGHDLHKYLGEVKQIFQQGMDHPSGKVKVCAVKAIISMIIDYDEDKPLLQELKPLIPGIIECCVHTAKTEEEDETVLHCLSDLSATVPKMLFSNINPLFTACLQIAGNKDVSENFRSSALEVIVAFIETAPKTTKKNQELLPSVVRCCLAMMTELDDDLQEWLLATEEDEEDAEEVAMTGESSLDRVATALPADIFLPHFQSVVDQLNKNEDWKSKHAVLRSISTIGEGCRRQMEAKIENYMKIICPYSSHDHPRVRYACCNAIGQMSTDFSPKIQRKAHSIIVPSIVTCLENLEIPKVAAHAASALINFCEGCPQLIMSGYLPLIMKKLLGVLEVSFQQLQNKQMKVLVEQVVTAIASVAESSQELFKTYYTDLIRPLVFILENSNNEESKDLRGKTIECITFIGSAVGKEMFHADAIQIMNMLARVFQTMRVEDTEYMYMISSWTRFCTILGPDFAPFLPIVMEPVMRAATFEIEVGVMEEQQKNADNDWSYAEAGNGTVVGIRTTGIDEKTTACDMLVCYARQMKHHFIQYVEPVTAAMLKNLNFKFNDNVRTSSAEVMVALIDCVASQGVEAQRQLANLFIPALKEAINKENDLEVSGEFIGTLSAIIASLQTEGLTQSYVNEFVQIITHAMQHYIQSKIKYDTAEEDEENAESSEEIEVLSSFLAQISDFMHSLLKYTNGTTFVPCQMVFNYSMKLIQSQKDSFERHWGLSILVDIIEFVDVNISDHYPTLCQRMRELIQDEVAEIRQAAVYGIGILSLRSHISPQYIQEAMSAIPALVAVIEAEEARDSGTNTAATENAISAVVKIIENAPPQFKSDELIARFPTWLPVTEDVFEANITYQFFCKLYKENNPAFFGDNNSNLPRILSIALTAIGAEFFQHEDEYSIKREMTALVKHMYENTSPEFFQSVVNEAALESDQQETLNKLFQ